MKNCRQRFNELKLRKVFLSTVDDLDVVLGIKKCFLKA